MFKSRFLRRLYAGYVAIIVISTISVGILVSRQVTENAIKEIDHSLAIQAELLAEVAKRALQEIHSGQGIPSYLQETIIKLGQNTESRLTIVTNDGAVIADSRESPQKMDNHAHRPEISSARASGSSTVTRFSDTLQQRMTYRAQQVAEGQTVLGFVRVSLPLTSIDRRLTQLRLTVLFGASIAAVAALLLAFYFAKRFSDPITKLTDIAEAISQGDYSRRIAVTQNDEVGTLASAFNRMARNSEQRVAEITSDRNRLAKIFAGMVEGVIQIDQDQKITLLNHAAAEMLNISATECIGKPIWEETRAKEINDAFEQAINSRKVVKARMHRSSKTDAVVIDIYAAVLNNDADYPIGAVIVLHNVSELDHLERIRRDFVANASHELKTPITAIRGLIETIIDDELMDTSTRKSFTNKIHEQTIRLSSIVSDLMTISRLEGERVETSDKRFDLNEIAKQALASAAANCQDKGLSLKTKLPPQALAITGDPEAIRQLIDNLVDNAIKYTPANGLVSVTLDQEDQLAILTVEDSGIGISPQYQQRIFERFYRVDKARSRELGGTGLGLSIVKNIAEQHGGSVSLRSQPGVGSTFVVTLPIQSG